MKNRTTTKTLNYKIMQTLKNPTETKARKKHRCNFCQEFINEGQEYLKSTHVYDGQIYDWKTHKWCNKLANDLDMYSNCDEGVTCDDFMEEINEYYFNAHLNMFNEEDEKKYAETLAQLKYVNFNKKMWWVIRHLNKEAINNLK